LCLSPSSPQENRRGAVTHLATIPGLSGSGRRVERRACAADHHPDGPTISFHFVCIRRPPGLFPAESLSFRLSGLLSWWNSACLSSLSAVLRSRLLSSIGLCFACVSIPTICSSCEAVHGNPNFEASALTIRGPPDWKDSMCEMVDRHSHVMEMVKNVNGHDIIAIIFIVRCHGARECFLSTISSCEKRFAS
jgi:hypothetical protein